MSHKVLADKKWKNTEFQSAIMSPPISADSVTGTGKTSSCYGQCFLITGEILIFVSGISLSCSRNLCDRTRFLSVVHVLQITAIYQPQRDCSENPGVA